MTVPPWLERLRDAAVAAGPELVPGSRLPAGAAPSRAAPATVGGRRAAVLMLLSAGPYGPEVLLIERSAAMRTHAGQPAFPGGAVDPGDASPAAAAVREAAEETGLDPSGVEVLATLAGSWLAPSGFLVIPVLGWEPAPGPVHPGDPREVAAVHRVPVAELADPGHRWVVQHPSGYVGPAFAVRDMLVWGFTAGLLDRLLVFGRWEQPWDRDRRRELPAAARRLAARTSTAVPAVRP